jgi:4-amino-4-deoxy-L-arabinose transferase-like glycosyltransferase
MTTALDLAATPVADDPHADTGDDAAGRRPALLRRLWRGRPGEPPWVRPALLALLAGTALLYLVGLGGSGWANAFYSAAVQAGAHSWKAFFFGSSDAANFITVDKPPASLWVMDLSARLFGVNSWSILVPQALEGVACVGVLYLTVRRWFGPLAGLLAGLVLALTPVATLMFRFNNPDALLVLLLTLGAYAVTRAIEKGSTRWLLLAAAFVGLGFTTKMLQALLVVPAFAAAYAIAAPRSPWRRVRQLAVAGVALLVSCGWRVAIVQLWPTASRPYIGGSQTNSVVELVFGYNGLGRITGNETDSVVAGGAGGAGRAGAWGATGLGRLFSSSWGGQIAWLLPAALAFLVALLWLSRRAPRADRTRAAAVLWGGSLLVTAVVFSFAQGIIHEYYAVALAPAIGALVGIGATALWTRRSRIGWRLSLAGIIATTAVWSFVLLERSAAWQPWLRPIVLGGGLLAAALLVVADRLARRAALALAAVGVAVALAGPAVYSVQTAAATHSGSLPSAGPAVSGGTGGRFGPGGGTGLRFGGGTNPPSVQTGNGATVFNGAASANGALSAPTGAQGGGGAPAAPAGGITANGFAGPRATGGAGAGNAGGLLDASTPSAALVALLKQNADHYTWVAATVGAQSAAGYQLATDDPVMSLGGFNGSDPYPTLAEFQALVSTGKVHYFIAGGMGGSGSAGAGGNAAGSAGPGATGGPSAGTQTSGGSTSMSAIGTWVEAHFTSRTVGSITVYDLTSRSS